ncbi:hypothetical protein CCACVL1_00741, partial [Corchorus capsularis]
MGRYTKILEQRERNPILMEVNSDEEVDKQMFNAIL